MVPTLLHIHNCALYAHTMKRLQIMIDEDLDESLERQARDEGASKGALIRRYVRERLMPLAPIEQDPLWALVGLVEGEREDSARVDDVVYPDNRER